MKTTHPIYDVYFRIEAGYNDGRMSHEQHDRFYTEIRALFSRVVLRFWRIRRDVPPSSWERLVSTAIRRNSPARSRNRISPLLKESCDREPRFNIRQRTVTIGSTTLPSRRSWPTTGNTIPNSFFLRLSAPRIHRNTTFGMRFSRSW